MYLQQEINKKILLCSAADPGSGAFLSAGSGILWHRSRMEKIRIRDEHPGSTKLIFCCPWSSLKKVAGSGSGSVSQRYGAEEILQVLTRHCRRRRLLSSLSCLFSCPSYLQTCLNDNNYNSVVRVNAQYRECKKLEKDLGGDDGRVYCINVIE